MDLTKHFKDDLSHYLNHTVAIEHLPLNYTATWESFSTDESSIRIFPHIINQSVSNHFHDFFELLYVYKGCCKIYVDNTEIILNENDICLLNLQAKHAIADIDLSCNIVYYIMIHPSYFRSIYFQLLSLPSTNYVFDFFLESIANHNINKNYILFSNNNNTALLSLTNQVIEQHYIDKSYKNEIINFIASAFLIELSRIYQDIIYCTSQKELGNHTIVEIIEYINANYQTVTLKEVANYFNYSSTYLSLLIKKYSGINFTEIVHTFRLKKFCQLLIETNRSITDLALDVGITNRTWLTKKFKARFGISPSEFRRKYSH